MRSTLLVARHVFKDAVRDKVLYSIVAFAVLLIGTSFLIGQITAGQDIKIIKDLGLAAMALFGLFIAIFMGVGLVAREIDRRSIYSVIVKPVARHHFIVGKYLGLVATLLVNLSIMAAAYFAVLAILGRLLPAAALAGPRPPTDLRLLLGIAMIGVELALVTAIALFWSTFSSSALLSAGLTAGLWVAGQFSADLRNFGDVVDSPAVAQLVAAVYYVLPNMAAFDVKAQVVHGLPIGGMYVTSALAYAAVYAALLLTASVWIFSRRDLK